MTNDHDGDGGIQTPITDHPKLPDGVPLIAAFHDDRNRLSYYHPLLKQIDGVRTPVTKFVPVTGTAQTFLDVEYRDVTRFMQDLSTEEAFVRSDYSSGKYDGETGSRIESQDPYDIETTVLEMFRQLSRGKRRIGGRIAVREWIGHDAEVRYFIRDGGILYRDTLDDVTADKWPDAMVEAVASRFDVFAWSVDVIRHETTGAWYVIDLGLDGLYPNGNDWTAISEHLDETYTPQQYADEMPDASRFHYQR